MTGCKANDSKDNVVHLIDESVKRWKKEKKTRETSVSFAQTGKFALFERF